MIFKFAYPRAFSNAHPRESWHQNFVLFLQIVPASTNGVDEVNFRQMESGSMHHDSQASKKGAGGGEKNGTLKAVAGKPGGRNKSNITGDDEMETAPTTPSSMTTDKDDLFGAFANVTLHYDGET